MQLMIVEVQISKPLGSKLCIINSRKHNLTFVSKDLRKIYVNKPSSCGPVCQKRKRCEFLVEHFCELSYLLILTVECSVLDSQLLFKKITLYKENPGDYLCFIQIMELKKYLCQLTC